MVACAYRVPSGPVIWPEAVATRRPELITCPVATTLGVSTVSGFTRFTLSSRVVYAWPGPSLECTAQAHRGVEQGAEDAAVDRSDRVVQVLADVEREGDPARFDLDDAESQQRGDRRGRNAPLGDAAQVIQAGHLPGQRRAHAGILPGDLAAAARRRRGSRAGGGPLHVRAHRAAAVRCVSFLMKLSLEIVRSITQPTMLKSCNGRVSRTCGARSLSASTS